MVRNCNVPAAKGGVSSPGKGVFRSFRGGSFSKLGKIERLTTGQQGKVIFGGNKKYKP